MNSTGFRSLVKNFTALTPEEYEQLKQLSSTFPYSQLLHVLKSRASKDLVDTDHTSVLNRTAIYSTERAIVKWAMTTPSRKRSAEVLEVAVTQAKTTATPVAEAKVAPAPVVEVKATSAPAAVVTPTAKVSPSAPLEKEKPILAKTASPVKPLEGDALRKDLAAELKKLQRLKHDFEVSYETFQHNLHGQLPPVKSSTPSEEPPLIEELKTTRKKLKMPSAKATEQHEIIDQFIKTKPTMPKAKPAVPDADLAEDSVNYTDNIVSETLVSILVKQGKKVKAIEMLKKLIWKFPQKKAYFAAQIEDLKN